MRENISSTNIEISICVVLFQARMAREPLSEFGICKNSLNYQFALAQYNSVVSVPRTSYITIAQL